jgi:hypothetical protein
MRSIIRSEGLKVLAAVLLLTGCITIEENYTFKKDGSGTMEYVVDMRELGELMASFGGGEGDSKKKGGKDDMGNFDMSAQVAALKALPGISKVKLDGKKKWVQRLSFSFKDVTSLNRALNELMKDSSNTRHEFFRWEGNTLVRTNNDHARMIGASMGGGGGAEVLDDPDAEETEVVEAAEGEDDGEEVEGEGFDTAMFLEGMKYKYSFKFAEAVGEVGRADGMVQEKPSARELRMNTDFGYISREPAALDLRITLQR